MTLPHTAEQLESIIHAAMPSAKDLRVTSLDEESAVVQLQYREWMLRPGGTLSGPAIMTAADAAMYALLMGHYGAELLAVTSDLSMRFLAKPVADDLIATARFLSQGKRLTVMQVEVRNNGVDRLVAHVTGSYMRPQ